jgi:hypothetical protein
MNTFDKSPFDFEDPKTDNSSKLTEEMDFNFEQLQPVAVVSVGEVSADLTVHNRLMMCVCPTCAVKTEVDLAQMPEHMFMINCLSCNKQIHVIRESSACRAKRQSFEINCSHCGKLLDHHAHCNSCGKSFPDFFVTVDPEKARSESRKNYIKKIWSTITDLNVSFNPSLKSTHHDAAPGYSPTRTTSGESNQLSRSYLVPALSLIVAIALTAGGVFAYKSYKSGQMFVENYVKALYCIKTGVDTNLTKSILNKTEWEAATASGRIFYPSSNANDDMDAVKLHTEIDKYMLLINKPPKKFSQAQSNLKEIHKIYVDSEKLAQSKPTSLRELSGSIETFDKKMSQTSQELKSSLPGALKQELEKAKLKYRGLKDF